MQIAARSGAWATSGGGCPYVTDGLVAWFDSTVNPPTLENGWTNNANAADVRPVTQGLIDSSGALVFFLGNQRFVFADSLPQAPMTIQVVVFKYGGNGAIYDAQNDYFWWAWGGVCKSAYAGTRIGPPTWTVGKTLTYRVGDGIAAATMDAANGWNTTSANGGYLNVPIAFGYGWDGDQGLIGGRYKCLRIYNRALTDAEVIANEAADAARFPLDAPFAINDASGVVSSIGLLAFNGCASLTEIVLPNVAHPIYTGTFSGCTSLKYVDVPNATDFERAFSGATSVEFVRVGIVEKTTGWSSLFEGDTANRCVFAPKCTVNSGGSPMYHGNNLLYFGLGQITEMSATAMNGEWMGSGSNLLAIIVKNTMASIQAVTNFPFGATYRSHSGQLHFACADGKITYDGTTWTATPWASVAELPTVCTDDYTFAVGGTNYRWNMATKEYEVVA